MTKSKYSYVMSFFLKKGLFQTKYVFIAGINLWEYGICSGKEQNIINTSSLREKH